MHGVRAQVEDDIEDVVTQEEDVIYEAPPQNSEPSDPFLNPPPSALGVESFTILEDGADNRLTLGKEVRVLVGLRNGANSPLNMTYQLGMLQSSVFYQKLAPASEQGFLEPGEELTLPYSFVPDKTLPPGEFTLSLSAFYESEHRMFANTYFNQTITLVEGKSAFDVQIMGLFVMICGILGSAFYFLAKYLQLPGFKKKRSVRKTKKDTGIVRGDSDDWLAGTAATTLGKPSSKKRVNKSKKKA